MDGSAEEEFRRFVAARLHVLRGLAYLTCGHWQAAEDAAASTLERLCCRWDKVTDPDRYAARMVVRAAIDEVRRPWRREVSADGSGGDPTTTRRSGDRTAIPWC